MSDVWGMTSTDGDAAKNHLKEHLRIIDDEEETLLGLVECIKDTIVSAEVYTPLPLDDDWESDEYGDSGFSGSEGDISSDDGKTADGEYRKPAHTPAITNDDESAMGGDDESAMGVDDEGVKVGVECGTLSSIVQRVSGSMTVCERQPVTTTSTANTSDVRVNPHDRLTTAINELAAELRINRTREERIRLMTGPFEMFNGSEKENYPDWIADVKFNVEDAWVSDELKLRHLKKRLEGKALIRFKKQLFNPTWKEALDHLERNYRIHWTITEKMLMFVTREQQGDENVPDYAGVLRQLCPFDDEAERESALKERLAAGLLREDFAVQAGVSADKGQSFGKIVEELANQEEVEERRRKAKKSVNCRLESCTRGGSEQSSDAISSVPDRSVQQIMKRKWGYRWNVRCYVCSGVGHKARDHESSGYRERYQMVNRESVRAQQQFQQKFYKSRRRMHDGYSDLGESELGRASVNVNWREQRTMQRTNCDREIEEIQVIKKPGHIGVNKLVKGKCERMNCDREIKAALVKKKTGHSLVNEQDKCEQQQGTSCDRENQEISFKEAWSERGQRARKGRASAQWVWQIKEDKQ